MIYVFRNRICVSYKKWIFWICIRRIKQQLNYLFSNYFFSSFPAILNPITKRIIEIKPVKSNVSGLYKTSTLPKVNPIIE